MDLHVSTTYVYESIAALCAGGVLGLIGIAVAKILIPRQQRTTRSPQ